MATPEIEDRIREELRRAPAVAVCAYLFGSIVRGEARTQSDVDVAVLFEKPPEARLDAGPLDLEGALERAVLRPLEPLRRLYRGPRPPTA